ncbi:MAG: queuosine precursor transporter [Spirochaetales bacterium]|nr:queuosine precursor transporter [Leptospiraceae bacterium]MCP5482993.1 queuosine precursor transporter [Spirochaetales bacterium]MCP5484828.1 queuosine precursor transporter [Spirochaetales bacterium]
MTRSDRAYVFLACCFVGVLMLTNVIGTKLFAFLPDRFPGGFFGSPFVLPTGIITYPITFWITDIVSEVWGKRRADLMVIYGFALSLLMLVFVSIAVWLPPAEAWTMRPTVAAFFSPDHHMFDGDGVLTGVDHHAAQAAFAFTFEAPGVLLMASMLAYMVAQLLDNFLFHFWKRLTAGRHLWLRNNGSTLISQLVDTIIVNSIFLYFVFEMPFFASHGQGLTIVQVIITAYFFKMIMALLDTPWIYAGVFVLKELGIEPEPGYD